MTSPNSNSLKAAAKVSIGLLLVLLIGSIVFWKERMLFSDASYIVFRIINNGELQLQVGRYGAFVTQVFPYVASKLHLPLGTVLLLYSLSFNLFYLFVGVLLYRMRQYALTVVLALYVTLYVSDTYFWTNNEVHQGIAWMLLDFGLLQFLYEKWQSNGKRFLFISLPLFALLTFIAIYTHPLVMLSFGFLWVFFLWSKQGFFSTRLSIIYAFFVIFICVSKFFASQNNWYDGGFIHNITHTTLPAILKTFRSELAQDFWHNGFTNYWLLWVIFITGFIFLLLRKKLGLFAYTVLSCVLYFMLICLVFYPSKAFYIESEWMSLSILGSVAFVYFFVPSVMSYRAVVIVFLIIYAVRIGYIIHASETFADRLSFLEQVHHKMKKEKINKLIVSDEDPGLEDRLLLTWGLPYETILFSALNHDVPTKTMSYLKADVIEKYQATSERNCLISNFGPFCSQDINPDYFRLDTSSPYEIRNLKEITVNEHE